MRIKTWKNTKWWNLQHKQGSEVQSSHSTVGTLYTEVHRSTDRWGPVFYIKGSNRRHCQNLFNRTSLQSFPAVCSHSVCVWWCHRCVVTKWWDVAHLCAAADTPIEEFTPTPAFPALQYLESVDEGGVAWQAGLRTGDFLIEVRALFFLLLWSGCEFCSSLDLFLWASGWNPDGCSVSRRSVQEVFLRYLLKTLFEKGSGETFRSLEQCSSSCETIWLPFLWEILSRALRLLGGS